MTKTKVFKSLRTKRFTSFTTFCLIIILLTAEHNTFAPIVEVMILTVIFFSEDKAKKMLTISINN